MCDALLQALERGIADRVLETGPEYGGEGGVDALRSTHPKQGLRIAS